jgi:hypothetical protein
MPGQPGDTGDERHNQHNREHGQRKVWSARRSFYEGGVHAVLQRLESGANFAGPGESLPGIFLEAALDYGAQPGRNALRHLRGRIF